MQGSQPISTDRSEKPTRFKRLRFYKPRAMSRVGFFSVSAGVASGLGQAPFQFWPVAVLGLALGALLWLRAPDAKHASSIGWCLGFGAFLTTLLWFVEPFLVDPARHGWMIPFALFGMAGGLALFWGAAFGLARRFDLGLLGLPALWAGFELVRGYIFTGFPWGLPAYIWLDTAPAHVAAWMGPYGLTAVTFGLAALVAHCVQSWNGKPMAWPLIGLAAAFGALFAAGHAQLSQPLPKDSIHSVRIVQPNAAQHLKWHPDHIAGFYQTSLELSAPQGAELVIWPETSIAAPLYAAQAYLDEIAAHAKPAKTVVGLQRVDGTRGYNSAAVISASGQVESLYDKRHLVPFGEYMPLPALMQKIGLRSFTAQAGYGYSAGEDARLFDFGPLGNALPLICYEAIFPRELRSFERPDWLLQITNDAWFGKFSGPQQSLAQSRFRSIETGLPMVRAANTGVSAIIDAHGHIRHSIPLGQTGAVSAPLPQALPQTLYARAGELPIVIILMFWVLGAAVASIRRGTKESV